MFDTENVHIIHGTRQVRSLYSILSTIYQTFIIHIHVLGYFTWEYITIEISVNYL